jgi:hypothetical protein
LWPEIVCVAVADEEIRSVTTVWKKDRNGCRWERGKRKMSKKGPKFVVSHGGAMMWSDLASSSAKEEGVDR